MTLSLALGTRTVFHVLRSHPSTSLTFRFAFPSIRPAMYLLTFRSCSSQDPLRSLDHSLPFAPDVIL